jgi:hypothetical protein
MIFERKLGSLIAFWLSLGCKDIQGRIDSNEQTHRQWFVLFQRVIKRQCYSVEVYKTYGIEEGRNVNIQLNCFYFLEPMFWEQSWIPEQIWTEASCFKAEGTGGIEHGEEKILGYEVSKYLGGWLVKEEMYLLWRHQWAEVHPVGKGGRKKDFVPMLGRVF